MNKREIKRCHQECEEVVVTICGHRYRAFIVSPNSCNTNCRVYLGEGNGARHLVAYKDNRYTQWLPCIVTSAAIERMPSRMRQQE